MTKEEKRERRRVRHALADAVRKNHFSKDFKMVTTNRQWKAGVRRVVDQLLSGRNPQQVEKVFVPVPLHLSIRPNVQKA